MHKDLQEKKITDLLEEAYQIRGNDIKKSIILARKALALSQGAKLEKLVADSLNRISLFLMITGENEESIRCSRDAIAYYQQINDEKGIADAKYNLGGIYYKTNNHHLGLIQLLDCLSIYQKFGDYHNQARVHKSLGTIYEYFNDEKRAIQAYEESLIAAKKVNDLNLESNTLNPLSGIYLNKGDFSEAMRLIEKSIAIKNKTGDTRGLAFAYYGRGKIYIKTKEYDKAEQDFNEALEIQKKVHDPLGIAICYIKIGILYYEKGDFHKTIEIANIGIQFGITNDISLVTFKSYHLLYKTYKKLGQLDKSLEYLEIYLDEKEQTFNEQTQKIVESYERITRIEAQEKETKLQLEKTEILKKKNIAEESNRVKQDFLSTMSHEIRTPLNAIITISNLLDENRDPKEKELIESLRFSSNNLLLLINDILDFSKLEAGKSELDKYPSDLKQLLQNIKNTYNSMAKEKGLLLKLMINEGLAEVYKLDETKISQILGNLISNAIKFTNFGKVDIIVSKKGVDKELDLVEFKVKDTGPGIEKGYINTIFDSFSQSKSVTKRKEGGSGLGLAIVKKLVSLHESEIILESEENVGTKFTFTLKLEKATLTLKTNHEVVNELDGKHILLAEDNMVNAMVAEKLLSNWGIKTHHAKNGIEAIEKINIRKYDFILLDIHMPFMDGFEAVEIIRTSDNINVETPIFALTADITANANNNYEQYFNDFLLKPIEKDKLSQTLRSYNQTNLNS